MYTVSIVGRPNVGKSSLFNRILGKRVAVVDDTPGVTRDRQYRDATWDGCDFTLVDTGGLDVGAREGIPLEIAKQAAIACEESDAILFMVDAMVGITDMDALIARRLRKEKGAVLLVINKAESKRTQYETGAFVSLGFGEGHPISSLHGTGVGDLLDEVCTALRARKVPPKNPHEAVSGLRIAIVGRPNAGKSSLVNKLIKQDRMIVTPQPATTRDSIDTAMVHNGTPVVLIDTAGLRKKANVHDDVEYYCNVRSIESIRRCDVCVLMIDSSLGIEEQDLKIVRQIMLLHKGILVCFNKWDIFPKDHTTFDHLVANARETYMELRHVPMVSISALTGQRATQVLDISIKIKARMETKVPLADFKENVKEWERVHPHPVTTKGGLRILAADQVAGAYPIFRFFSANAKYAGTSYKRYLANKIYETYDLEGCPVGVEFHNVQKKAHMVVQPTPYPVAAHLGGEQTT
jgi:GTP-binding protein